MITNWCIHMSGKSVCGQSTCCTGVSGNITRVLLTFGKVHGPEVPSFAKVNHFRLGGCLFFAVRRLHLVLNGTRRKLVSKTLDMLPDNPESVVVHGKGHVTKKNMRETTAEKKTMCEETGRLTHKLQRERIT